MVEADLSLACRVHQHVCMLPLAGVVETFRPLPVESLAETPPFVLGVSIIRGEPVPVVDAGALVSGKPSEAGRYVTISIGERRVALAVGSVLGVRSFPKSSLHDLPSLIAHDGSGRIAALGALDGALLVFLESARIVPEAVWQAMARERAK